MEETPQVSLNKFILDLNPLASIAALRETVQWYDTNHTAPTPKLRMIASLYWRKDLEAVQICEVQSVATCLLLEYARGSVKMFDSVVTILHT